MIQEENSGLTIVHPVDRIKEVVEIEWSRIKLSAEKTALIFKACKKKAIKYR